MATRGMLARLQEDGKTYDTRYVHSDSYPDGVGYDLITHYTDPAKVDALFALGDLSSLGAELGEAHDGFPYEKNKATAGLAPEPDGVDWTRAYHRDRGEQLRLSTTPKDKLRLTAYENYGAEYVYIWQPEQRTWKGYSVGGKRLSPVKIRA